jgi:SAM-dependent methyltransferase
MSTPSSAPEQSSGTFPRREGWLHEAVATPETTLPAQMGKVFGYLKGMHATYLIDIGAKLGLFRRLAASPDGLQPEALASELGLDLGSVRRWCDTACALELLDYDPTSGYRLAPFMDQVLGNPDGTFYLGAFPDVHLMFARDYARLPELFRTGGTYSYQEHDQEFLRSVAEVTQVLPRMFLGAVMPKLPDLETRLNDGALLLDVGCGAGYAMTAFAERYPNVRCIGVDVEPTSIQMAQEHIQQRGLNDRVEARLVDGAALPAELIGTVDLVTMFLVLHEIRPEHKERVLAQCAQALRPGGLMLVFDERYASSPPELRDPTQIFAVMAQWYEGHWGNVINTREEIHALLSGAGLRPVDETSLSRFYIVTAEKPAS